MILYRKEPYPLQMKNIMLLDDVASGGVVYVNKATYDQALLLSDRFDGNANRLINAIVCKKNEIYITIQGLAKLIENMSKTMPEPINMLAPFLIFCAHNEGITWDPEDREFAYGVLHQYSQLIDFNAITLVPSEVRANITFPTALLNQYKTSWEDLCSSLEDKVMLKPQVVQTPTPAPVYQPAPASTTPAPAPVAATPVPTPAPVPAPAPEPVKEEPERELSEFEKQIIAIREGSKKKQEELQKKDEARKAGKTEPKSSGVGLGAKESDAKASNDILNEYDF